MKIINEIPPQFPDKTWVSWDTEWHDLNQHTIHRPTSGGFACMTLCADGENVYFLDNEQKAKEAIKQIQNTNWWIQEAKFDLTQMSRFVPSQLLKHDHLIDTLLMERIIHAGLYDRFSLDNLARRYCGIYLEKELQKSFQGSEMNQEQVEYACRDAQVLWQVGMAQKQQIMKDDMYIWKNVDLPMLWAVMAFQGMRLNALRWKTLAEENKKKSEKINETLLYSPYQFAKLKAQLRSCGFPKLPDTQEDTLAEFIENYPNTEAAKIAALIIESREYSHNASTYGENWITNYLEQEREDVFVIHADFNITGAETGRMSCDSPNLQNVPVRETKAYRECFIPRPGHVLIDADYSQQEVGIAAYLSQDKLMIDMFNSGQDVYIAGAKILFGKDITKDDPLRVPTKALILGLDYGLSKYGLAKKINVSLDEAEELISLFNSKFPQMAEYQRKQSKETYQTKTILGRRCYLNPYSFQCPNNALNNPVQGTAGDMLKVAVGQMYKNWKFPFEFNGIGVFHDEFLADCPEEWANEEAKFICSYMEEMANWMLPGMAFRIDAKLCHSWAEKG